MVFFVTTLNHQGESRKFSLMGDIEAGIKLFDHIAKKGDKLVKAIVVDGNRSSELPLESFNGLASLPVLKALESEWKQVLSKPINTRSVGTQRCSNLVSRRIDRHEVCILHLEQAVVMAEQRLQRVFDTIHREPHRTRVLHHLEGVLKRHWENLVTERASLSTFLDQVLD